MAGRAPGCNSLSNCKVSDYFPIKAPTRPFLCYFHTSDTSKYFSTHECIFIGSYSDPISAAYTYVYCHSFSSCQSHGNPIADTSTFGYFTNKDLKRAANVF